MKNQEIEYTGNLANDYMTVCLRQKEDPLNIVNFKALLISLFIHYGLKDLRWHLVEDGDIIVLKPDDKNTERVMIGIILEYQLSNNKILQEIPKTPTRNTNTAVWFNENESYEEVQKRIPIKLPTDGSFIITSSPIGDRWFHDLWMSQGKPGEFGIALGYQGDKLVEASFVPRWEVIPGPIKRWYSHPRKNEKWFEEMKQMGSEQFVRLYNNEPAAIERPVGVELLSEETVRKLNQDQIGPMCKQCGREMITSNLRMYHCPDTLCGYREDRDMVIGLDLAAEGTSDQTVTRVYNCPDYNACKCDCNILDGQCKNLDMDGPPNDPVTELTKGLTAVGEAVNLSRLTAADLSNPYNSGAYLQAPDDKVITPEDPDWIDYSDEYESDDDLTEEARNHIRTGPKKKYEEPYGDDQPLPYKETPSFNEAHKEWDHLVDNNIPLPQEFTPREEVSEPEKVVYAKGCPKCGSSLHTVNEVLEVPQVRICTNQDCDYRSDYK